MKKLMIFASLIVIGLAPMGASAQNIKLPVDEGVMMQGGRMMEIKSGVATPMQQEVVLRNGARVSMNGAVTTKEGKQMMLKEGQTIDIFGNTCGNWKAKKGECALRNDKMPSEAKTVDQPVTDK